MNSFIHKFNYTEYTIEWTLHENKLSIEYNIYYDDANGGGTEKDLYLTGDVKWDGCSNWDFKEQERVMLHFCTLDGINLLSELPRVCWNHASKTIECFEGAE